MKEEKLLFDKTLFESKKVIDQLLFDLRAIIMFYIFIFLVMGLITLYSLKYNPSLSIIVSIFVFYGCVGTFLFGILIILGYGEPHD